MKGDNGTLNLPIPDDTNDHHWLILSGDNNQMQR